VIWLDDRAGSKDLYSYLLSTAGAPEVVLTRLDFGDVMFSGLGQDDVLLTIGIEYKTVGDAVDCIKTGRFAGYQLPGLLKSFEIPYLLVEGRCKLAGEQDKFGADGRNREYRGVYRGNITYAALAAWLASMESSGIRLRQAYNKEESAALIVALWHWWQKPWASHHSLKAIHEAAVPLVPLASGSVAFTHEEPTIVAKVAKQLAEGVGWDKANAIAEVFKTPEALLLANEKQLMEVHGIGKKLAKAILEGIHEQGKDSRAY
jgi:ERCC4-type nuclease